MKELYQIRRGTRLTGDELNTWFSSHGSRTPAPLTASTLLGDAFSADGFLTARLWHTRLHYWRLPSDKSATLTMLLPLEGSIQLHTEGLQHDTTRGEWTMFRDQPGTTVRCAGNVAYYLATVRASRMSGLRLSVDTAHAVSALSRLTTAFTGLVNGLFNDADIPISVTALQAVRTSIENLLISILVDAALAAGCQAYSGSNGELVDRAEAILRDNFTDTGFTVMDLAVMLNVTREHLYRAYAPTGTTPGQTLTTLRITAARNALEDAPSRDNDHLSKIATASGFRSVRAMRRALSG